MKTVEWRGQPVWILRRTPDMLDSIKKTDDEVADPKSLRDAYPTPEYAQERIPLDQAGVLHRRRHLLAPRVLADRSARRRASPALGADPGFVCPCHGSTFDLAGRVFKNKPAPDNLECRRTSTCRTPSCVIGDDGKA